MLLSTQLSYAVENHKYHVEKLTTVNNLAHNDIQDMMQDSYGYIWIATNGGLSRYDGYEFTNYTNNNQRGLESILILDLCEDKDKNLWISTADKGVFYYFRKENRFIHSSKLCDIENVINVEVARHLCQDKRGDIWFYDRLSKSVVRIVFDSESMKITSSQSYEISPSTASYVSSIIAVEDDLYIGTHDGLLRYSNKLDKFENVATITNSVTNISHHNGQLYIISTGKLFRYDIKSCQSEIACNVSGIKRVCWSDKYLFAATSKGVYKMAYDSTSHLLSSLEEIDEYKNFTVSDMTLLKSGELCVSFIKEAMRIYYKNTKPFKRLNNFGNNHITPIYPGADNTLWVGTDGNGYYIYNDINDPNSIIGPFLNGSTISSIIYSDYYSKYFIATESGIYSQKSLASNVEILERAGTSKQLCADGKYIWIASYSMGLTRVNLETSARVTLTPQNSSLKSDIVRGLLLDTSGDLWVATDQGLYIIKKSDKYKEVPILHPFMPEYTSKHYIIPLHQDSNGDIWYGTLGDGLHHIVHNGNNYNIEKYDTQNILSSNIVNSITEDNNENLWISHNSAISKINIDKQKSTTYDLNNGLQNYGFYDLSVAHTKNNTIMFGGVGGVTMFDPDAIKVDTVQGKPHLTDFKIFNSSVLNNKVINDITDSPLESTSHISLKHNQNSFSFTFSGFNYTNTKKQTYSYKLSGFDKDWTEVEPNNNRVYYTNIPHGEYIFSLRTTNSDGVWNPNQLDIQINIAPPFWLTWYAYLLYVVIVVTTLYLYMFYYRRSLERENAVKFARMEKNKVQELLDARIQFITNVSHEFRTPLTLILSPLQSIMSDPQAMKDKKWSEAFTTMLYNAETLMRLVNEFLSFQKRDSKHLKLNLKYDRFDSLVEVLISHMVYLAESKGIEIEYKRPSNPIYLCYDAEHIEQIVYNLLSNAVKHTPSGGVVTVSFVDSDEKVEFTVSDTGEGIPLEAQPQIFNRFVSLDSAIGGIGIGLSLTKNLVELHNGSISFVSSEGEGTTFTVIFPKDNTQQAIGNNSNEDLSQDHIQYNSEIEPLDINEEEEDDNNRKTMLIVDDNEQILKLLKSLFEDQFKVIFAKNGVEGFNIAQSYIPDIIISDVMMPLMDGFEFCKLIKENKNTSHIPIILLTAKASKNDIADGYRHRADGYCTKPFDNKVLIELVSSILNNRLLLAQKIKSSEVVIEIEGDDTTEQDKVLLKRMTEYIEANIGNTELKVSDICNEVGLRQVILNKKLRSLLDMTASSFIRTVRLKRAAELLRTGRYTVSSVAYDTGFTDLRNFRNSFKKEFGVFPQAYKTQHKSTSE